MEGWPIVMRRSRLPALAPPSRVIVGRPCGRMQSARLNEKMFRACNKTRRAAFRPRARCLQHGVL